jgi:cation diffusion facilitator CzcD-associated flavoprotein CzcO
MTTSSASVTETPYHPAPDVDVLVVGAGITGIYQLYRSLEAGFSVQLVEAGSGVGGTWYWNRYPGARFDSESYTYGYLFSWELFDDWEWQEHFAAQPETERYLNHVVDRFDLRRHMRFDASVTSAVWDSRAGCWNVTLIGPAIGGSSDGSHDFAGSGSDRVGAAPTVVRARYVVAATGVLSVPYTPDVPGRDRFRGVQHHTGCWPADPVDFRGKRVAVVGTSSSGVQVVPTILGDVASLTVYQRTANWCTPLNNTPITPEEQRRLRADFEDLCQVLNTSISGFAHPVNERTAFSDSAEERQAFYERMWASPGFMKLTSNYADLLFNEAANDEWCEFIAGKIRSIVRDPQVAERLIPKDHRFGEKRPPFVTGYFEAFNDRKVSLVDLRETPLVRMTETGIETTDGVRELDIVVWATGFDFGTGALARMGIVGRDRLALTDHWADGPTTFLGVQTRGFPNLFFPGGPHAAAGNNPRYNGDQVDFVTDVLVRARSVGCDVVEVSAESEERWTRMVDKGAAKTTFGTIGQYVGGNIPGKPRRYLLNTGGRPKLFEIIAATKADGYSAFEMSRLPARSAPGGSGATSPASTAS